MSVSYFIEDFSSSGAHLAYLRVQVIHCMMMMVGWLVSNKGIRKNGDFFFEAMVKDVEQLSSGDVELQMIACVHLGKELCTGCWMDTKGISDALHCVSGVGAEKR